MADSTPQTADTGGEGSSKATVDSVEQAINDIDSLQQEAEGLMETDDPNATIVEEDDDLIRMRNELLENAKKRSGDDRAIEEERRMKADHARILAAREAEEKWQDDRKVILKTRILLFLPDRNVAFKKVISGFLAYIDDRVARAKKGGAFLKTILFEREAQWDLTHKVGHIFLEEGADTAWILSTLQNFIRRENLRAMAYSALEFEEDWEIFMLRMNNSALPSMQYDFDRVEAYLDRNLTGLANWERSDWVLSGIVQPRILKRKADGTIDDPPTNKTAITTPQGGGRGRGRGRGANPPQISRSTTSPGLTHDTYAKGNSIVILHLRKSFADQMDCDVKFQHGIVRAVKMNKPDVFYEYASVNMIPLGKGENAREDRKEKIRRLLQNSERFGIRPDREVDDRQSFEEAKQLNDAIMEEWEEIEKPKLENLLERIKRVEQGDGDEALLGDADQVRAEVMSVASTQSKTQKKKAGKMKKRLIEEVRKYWKELADATTHMLDNCYEAKGLDETLEAQEYVDDLEERLKRYQEYQIDPVRLQLD